jgi:hypothetical protein
MTPQTCSTLLKLSGWGFTLFGLIWVSSAFASFDAPGRMLTDLLDWPFDGKPETVSREFRWLSAIGAGLTAGIGLMFVTIIAPLIKHDDTNVRAMVKRGVLISFTAWYVIDSAGSIASGVPSNAVFNTLFYAMVAIPLWLVKT